MTATPRAGTSSRSPPAVRLAPRPSRAPAIWKLVFAGALIGGGTYVTVEADSLASKIGEGGSSDTTKRDFFRYTGGIGLLAGGGALAIVGVVGLVSESRPWWRLATPASPQPSPSADSRPRSRIAAGQRGRRYRA